MHSTSQSTEKSPDLIQKISTYCLDAIFPKRCLGCRDFDTWLCKQCHTRFGLLVEQKCPLCTSAITPEGAICLECARKKGVYIDGVFVASYQDAFLKKVIHTYKYRFIRELASPLALLLAQALQNSHLKAPDLIIPVPLHNRRLRWRGFNQSLLLAQALDLQIPLEIDILKRSRFTKAQVRVKSRSKRLTNLSKAFCVKETTKIQDKHILLIDDITTTATTFNECAKVLKKAGAHRVTGLAIARD